MFGKALIWAGAALACALALSAPAQAAKPVVGKPAPDFQVTTFDGKKLSLADFKGQVLIVNVWATWCAPCLVELPLINDYYRIEAPNGLRVVAVTTEDSIPASSLKPLTKVLAFPLAHHFKGAGYLDTKAVPMSYVIDRKGVVRDTELGSFTLDRLNQVLIPLLQESPPEPGAAPATAASLPGG